MKKGNIEWIIGNEKIKVYPLQPYSDIVIDFLDGLSNALRHSEARKYSDLMSLSFWCRKSNIIKLKEQQMDGDKRIGRGMIFHITPSNVPVNFAFSYFFGLLSGNSNIVRVPSKDFPQISIICNAIAKLFEEDKYALLKETTAFVKYGHEDEITQYFSDMADGRIIWGGDTTIKNMRQFSLKPKCVDVVFADRYSMGIINSDSIITCSEEGCTKLAQNFYNDTYLMDQNACSTPHLLLWMGSEQLRAQEIFWKSVYEASKKYNLEDIKAVDKYTDLCMLSIDNSVMIDSINRYDNLLYVVGLKELPQDICSLRGKFGMFYQCSIDDLSDLTPYITEKIQSMLYYGFEKNIIYDWVVNNHLTGIDRIVPFGKSLDIGVVWDGYDIVAHLSRKVMLE